MMEIEDRVSRIERYIEAVNQYQLQLADLAEAGWEATRAYAELVKDPEADNETRLAAYQVVLFRSAQHIRTTRTLVEQLQAVWKVYE